MKHPRRLIYLCLFSILFSVLFPNANAVTLAEETGLIDELNGFTMIHQRSNMRIETADKAFFGNDASRMVRNTTSTGYLLYKTSMPINTFTAYSYSYIGVDVPMVEQRFYASTDGLAYTEVKPNLFNSGAAVSNWQLYIYEALQMPANTQYLKIEFAGDIKSWTPQLSKLVINQNVVSVLADPLSGLIGDEPLAVSLSTTTPGAAVFYKLNGDTAYNQYTGPLQLTKFTTIDTFATKDGLVNSPVKSYTYYAKADRQIDRYGQVNKASFPAKITSDEQLAADAAADQQYYGSFQTPTAFDEIGGMKGSKEALRLEAKGFFNIQHVNGRPMLVSPQGAAYFSLGMNGITNNETFTLLKGQESKFEWVPSYDSEYRGAFQGSKDVFSFYMANKYKKTGSIPTQAQFFAEAVDRIKKWGFNSAGAWGSGTLSAQNGLPYTLVLPINSMGKPSEIKIFDIFADDAVARVDEAFSKMLPSFKDDPLLIGYFVDNEYHYEKFFTVVPKLKGSKTGIKRRLVQMLQEKYVDIAAFNMSWGTKYASFTDLNEAALYIDTAEADKDMVSFFRLYLDTYYSTVKRLFAKYDTNHLLLGDRWLTLPMLNTKVRGILAEEAGKYMDVISINHYAPNLDVTMLNEVHAKSGGKPILLSEWSYGTAEQGLNPIVAGAATNEQERAWRYRNYVEGAASLPFVVGTHWFDYVDQAATGRWFEGLTGERYNTGLINVADRPYKTFLEGVMLTHNDIYDVMLGKKAPFKHDFGGGLPGGGTGKNQVIEIPYTSSPVPIDGEINGYAAGSAGKATLTVENRVGGAGGESITADYSFAWDEQHLYVTAKVNEPTPMKNSFQNSNIWKGDGLELFFGPSELELGGALQYDDRQIIISSGLVNQTHYWLWFNTGRQSSIEMKVKETGNGQGYVIEAALPWDTVQMQPGIGREFLFDFGFNESEDGLNRKRQYEWNGTSRNNLDRGLWGNAKLIGAVDQAAPVITVTGVVYDGKYTDQAVPVVAVQDEESGVKHTSIQLDGAEWTSGAVVAGPGLHSLVVTAEDHAGNTAQQQVSFEIYGSTKLQVQPANGVYSDTAQLKAALTDQNGKPVTGETVSFRVYGLPAGTAVTNAQGIAELPYPVKLGAGSYPIEAQYAQSEIRHLRGSDSASLLQVEREGSALAYADSRIVSAGQPIHLAAQLSEQADGSLGTLAGLSVTFSVYAIEPNGTKTPVSLPSNAAVALTDAAGRAASQVALPPGLYEVHFLLRDNPYYEAARTSSDLAVTGLEAMELKIKGYIVLPNDADYARDWNGKLHLDVEVKRDELNKWTASIGSTDQKLDIYPSWTVIVNNKAYLQGQFTIQGQVYTIRLLTQESGSMQDHLSLQLWRGQSDDRSADTVLLHAPFQGNIVIK